MHVIVGDVWVVKMSIISLLLLPHSSIFLQHVETQSSDFDEITRIPHHLRSIFWQNKWLNPTKNQKAKHIEPFWRLCTVYTRVKLSFSFFLGHWVKIAPLFGWDDEKTSSDVVSLKTKTEEFSTQKKSTEIPFYV